MEVKNKITHKKKNCTPSREELKNAIVVKMKELNLWRDELSEEIPTYWDNCYNFVIFSSKFFVDEQWTKAGSFLWECVSEVFSGKSIALVGRIQNNDLRSPNAKVVHGTSPWVVYLDNGIWYTWNVEFTMFCTGNVSERHRVAKLDCKGKIVVDMFAGIGYFTLPYLIHARANHVFACEWNPKSVEALRKNLTKNRVAEKCTLLEGDVRFTSPRGVADHVNLGLIPSCEEYWPTAAEILKSSGGMLHVHGNVTSFSLTRNFNCHCEKCLTMLQALSIDVSDLSEAKSLSTFMMKNIDPNLIGIESISNNIIKWKKIEWFVWSIHICHSFCDHLSRLTNTAWTVKPNFIHKIKEYAPHITHLVLDVLCENSLECLNFSSITESQL